MRRTTHAAAGAPCVARTSPWLRRNRGVPREPGTSRHGTSRVDLGLIAQVAESPSHRSLQNLGVLDHVSQDRGPAHRYAEANPTLNVFQLGLRSITRAVVLGQVREQLERVARPPRPRGAPTMATVTPARVRKKQYVDAQLVARSPCRRRVAHGRQRIRGFVLASRTRRPAYPRGSLRPGAGRMRRRAPFVGGSVKLRTPTRNCGSPPSRCEPLGITAEPDSFLGGRSRHMARP